MNYKKVTYTRGVSSRKSENPNSRGVGVGCVRESNVTCPSCEIDQCVSYCEYDGYPSLAMVYPAKQCWRAIDDGEDGFKRGTIFNELNKPFMGDKCRSGGRCK